MWGRAERGKKLKWFVHVSQILRQEDEKLDNQGFPGGFPRTRLLVLEEKCF